jgi:hypothetical protein
MFCCNSLPYSQSLSQILRNNQNFGRKEQSFVKIHNDQEGN